MKRLVARLSGLVALAGLAGSLGADLLSGIAGNHAETLLRDED